MKYWVFNSSTYVMIPLMNSIEYEEVYIRIALGDGIIGDMVFCITMIYIFKWSTYSWSVFLL